MSSKTRSKSEKRRTTPNMTMEPEALGKLIRDILREEIKTALTPIQSTLNRLEDSLKDCNSKVKSLEEATVAMDGRLDKIEKDYKELKEKNDGHVKRIVILENEAKKFNLRILGLKNKVEEGQPTAFVQRLLYNLFGEDVLGPPPLVRAAYRTGQFKENQDRCMIVKMISMETKTKIQRLASGKRGKLTHRDQKLSIYPDLPTELRDQQAAFKPVRELLSKTGLRYGVSYPAKLLITFNDVTHSFVKAEEAMTFYNEKIKPSLPS